MEAINARIIELLSVKEDILSEIKSIRNKLQKNAETLSDSRFGELAGGLRDLIFHPKHRNYTKPHTEFLRRAVVGHVGQHKEVFPRDYQECLSFVKTFVLFKRKIAIALETVDTGRGDDGHGDLVDALPLCPLEELQVLLNTPENFDAWEEKQKSDTPVRNLLHAEMYNQMRLEEALEVYIRYNCSQSAIRPETPQELEITICHTKHQDEYITEIKLPDFVLSIPQAVLLDALVNNPNKLVSCLKRKCE